MHARQDRVIGNTPSLSLHPSIPLFFALLSLSCVTRTETYEVPGPIADRLAFDGNLIRPGVDSMAIFLARAHDTIEIGWAVDRIEVQTIGGERALVRTYDANDRMFGEQHQEIVDRVRGIKPLHHRLDGMGRRFDITFRGDHIQGWREADDSPAREPLKEIPFPRTAINSASFDLAVRTMPLENEFTMVIQGFSGLTESFMSLEARVTGTLIEPNAPEPYVMVDVRFDTVPWVFMIGERTRSLHGMQTETPVGRLLYRNVLHSSATSSRGSD